MPTVRVAGRDRAELAEILDLLHRHIGVTEQMIDRVDQHRAMTGRQNKPIPIRPTRLRRVDPHVPGKEDRRSLGHSHGHSSMPGISSLDRIHREHTDGVRHLGEGGVGHAGGPWV